MGRTSDYTKQVRNEECENTVETKKSSKSFTDIKRMFAKEPMTAEQFGIYLGECKAAGDFISDKTIKRYIEKLCKMSDGKITPSKFMKTVDGTDVYIIQPEIQELLVAMFDTDFFGAKGKPKAGIDVKQRLRAQLAENVEIYLDEDIKKQVKSAPQFLNARLEDILTEKINNEVRGMFATMQDSDDTIQYQLMLETLDRLVAIRRWMNEWNARINLIKQEFAKTEQEKQDAKNKTGLFKHKQLQDILIDVISNLLEGKEIWNMAYSNAEIYDRNKSEAEREQKLLSKLKRISAKGNNAEVKQDRDGNWIVYEVKKTKAIV